ncbi:MAG TPA: ABC transporter permease [Chloroflexota bacterium]|nr:ABC transporter permease [Chloroflexota bacterium]
MLSAIAIEVMKLKRSYAALLCAASPALVAVLTVLITLAQDEPSPWMSVINGVAEMWSYFMLPMSITALTVLVAQLEHGSGAWDHLLAQPVPRWHVFAAKGIAVTGLVAAMSAVLFLLVPAAGFAAELLGQGTQLAGPVPWADAAALLARMFAASLLLIALQLWVALRFRSFVPGLAIGAGGTFAAVVVDQVLGQGPVLPWLIAQHAISDDPWQSTTAIGVGIGGGLVIGLLMVMDLSRLEFARA